MDNFVIALSRYRRRRYDEAITLCDEILQKNEQDQSVWILKCKSLTRKQFLDDLEIDEEGIGDMLLDENSVNMLARPGTSLQRPNTSNGKVLKKYQIYNIKGIRPMTNQGRMMTGFARPTTNRPTTSDQSGILKTARQGVRIGTSRPVTQGGRYVRLGTASLQSMGGSFIQVDKLDLKKLAKKPVISRSLCDYLIYVEHNPKKALELASEATIFTNYNDWWWKERLGKCYFMVILVQIIFFLVRFIQRGRKVISECSKELGNDLDTFISCKVLENIKIDDKEYILDSINLIHPWRFIIKDLQSTLMKSHLQLGWQEYMINQTYLPKPSIITDKQIFKVDKQTLGYESSNLEAVASIAAYHFYIDQPEVSLKFYSRLIQLGVQTAEIWNNLALCCFYDGQYDLFYTCFEKALILADESSRADIWYNISHVFINLGDLGTAQQCLKLTVCFDNQHAEAFNNIGIISSRRGENDKARNNYQLSMTSGPYLYEPAFNQALLLFKGQEYQMAYQTVQKSLTIYPEHFESLELKRQIEKFLQNI